MLYRLAFQVTADGYLRVTGVARDSSVLSALHLNDRMLQPIAVNLEEIVQIEPFRSVGTIATIGPTFQPRDSIENVETPESAFKP